MAQADTGADCTPCTHENDGHTRMLMEGGAEEEEKEGMVGGREGGKGREVGNEGERGRGREGERERKREGERGGMGEVSLVDGPL